MCVIVWVEGVPSSSGVCCIPVHISGRRELAGVCLVGVFVVFVCLVCLFGVMVLYVDVWVLCWLC